MNQNFLKNVVSKLNFPVQLQVFSAIVPLLKYHTNFPPYYTSYSVFSPDCVGFSHLPDNGINEFNIPVKQGEQTSNYKYIFLTETIFT